MFITSELTPGEMLAELLKGRPTNLSETSVFAKLRHDKDLCPRFAKQISFMLDVYSAYGQEVHDIQSMRDDGIDVLFTYQDQDGKNWRVGLQIKSDDEFCKWEAGKYSLVNTLKAQYSTAIANGKLDDFYVLLCVDAIRHKSRIRTVCSELKNFNPIKIVEPQDLLDLYEMDSTELWAQATRLLCHNDTILKKASEEVSATSPDISYLIISLMCHVFEGSYEVSTEYLFDLWSDWHDFSGNDNDHTDRLSDILWHLLNVGILSHGQGNDYVATIENMPVGLCALYYDLRVRQPKGMTELRDQILCLTGLLDLIDGPESGN